jgi:hypothetical protein
MKLESHKRPTVIRLIAPTENDTPQRDGEKGWGLYCVTPLNFGGFRITASGVFTKSHRNMPALSQIFKGERT